ncbi:hypothetical protein UFOVP396_39 [uncultured Caudovirales phage]|jgi:hypothetical protein|uniref:Uncharacterized protein n=1 Tax=uncultured Caudovirales phage TaxID=2100421 RepID=A0A6J5M133_9CAUD|nr:hypothetical protein UFOVP396_39 [uncultured Caudovirales phage]
MFVNKELIDHLNKLFPNKVPDISENERQIWFKAGQASVVSYLKQLLEEQNNNLLDLTIIKKE